MNDNLIKTLSYPLAIHLLYTNTMLLLQHFSIYNSGEIAGAMEISFRIIFALSYSWLTIVVLNKYPKILVFSVLAGIDGFAVFLKYRIFADKFAFANSVSLYFAFYTAIIIIVSGLIIRQTNNSKSVALSEKSEFKNANYASLLDRRKKLQNRINATRNDERKNSLQSELASLESEIKKRDFAFRAKASETAELASEKKAKSQAKKSEKNFE